MSRRRPKRCRQGHDQRGRHKRATSPETAVWEDGYLIPTRPPWMDASTYRRLADLRRTL